MPLYLAKYVIEGTAPQGEIFRTGFWCGMDAEFPNQGAFDTAAGEVVNLLVDNALPAWTKYIGSDTAYTGVTVYGYVDGTPAAYGQGHGSIGSGQGTGIDTGSPLPLQTCVVQSLRSATPGRSGRGRMYLPCTTVSLSGHQLSQAQCDELSAATATFLGSTMGNGDINGAVCVYSRTKHAAYPLTEVIVDSRLDVQRRRADHEAIEFTSTAAVEPV